MSKEEFIEGRRLLGKTQRQMAQLMGTSLKAVQSFEQGWRNVPIHIERQLLFLLTLKNPRRRKRSQACWVIRHCPRKTRQDCPAWEFKAGHLCWLINGTICHGQVQESWQKKMAKCRRCEVFQTLFEAA